MKRIIGLVLLTPLLLLTGCGNSTGDLYGKWVFSDLEYYDAEYVKTLDAFEIQQTKELFKGMTYNFKDDTHFTVVTPNLNEETDAGTFTLENGGEDLVLKFTNDEKRFHIREVAAKRLVLEAYDKDNKTLDKVSFVYTK